MLRHTHKEINSQTILFLQSSNSRIWIHATDKHSIIVSSNLRKQISPNHIKMQQKLEDIGMSGYLVDNDSSVNIPSSMDMH